MTPGPPQLSTGLAVEPERQCSRGHPNPAANNYCAQCGLRLRPGGPPSWNTLAEMLQVVTYRPHLQRTLLTAVVVGTVLFCINQLNVVVEGNATTTVWIKTGLTYCVPFIVSNIGILIATRRHP